MSAGDLLPSGVPPRHGWSLVLRAFGRALLRLVLILLIGAVLAAIFIWGVPALTQRFIVPVEENRERLERFQASQEQANRQFAQKMDSLVIELATLEAGRLQDAQAIATLQAQFIQAQETLAMRIADSESDLSGALDRLEDFDRSLNRLSVALDRLEAREKSNQEAMETIIAKDQSKEISIEALRREISLLKVMELLIRSRLFLMQSNYGLARQDVQSARDLLAGLESVAPAYQLGALREIITRLDLALANLPDRPVLAADDLEIAWSLLVLGLPGEAEATAAVAGTPAVTPPTPTIPALIFTETITGTVIPTLTGTLTPESVASPTPTSGSTGSTPSPTP